jgi:hypothetical protein
MSSTFENIETPLLYKGVKSSERKALVARHAGPFNIVGKEETCFTTFLVDNSN